MSRRLFNYIYQTLGLDLNRVIPLVPVPDNGCGLNGAHKAKKASCQIVTFASLQPLVLRKRG
jgi:hypothetical protein